MSETDPAPNHPGSVENRRMNAELLKSGLAWVMSGMSAMQNLACYMVHSGEDFGVIEYEHNGRKMALALAVGEESVSELKAFNT